MCSFVWKSFSFSFCPVWVLSMRIQIMNWRASRKFMVKSSSGAKFRSMARKFKKSWNFFTWWWSGTLISSRVLRCAQCSISIWLVDTVLERPWLESNIISPLANHDWSWLVTIRIFRWVFLDVLPCLKIVFIFLLSRTCWEHIVSDSERESFQKIYGEKF